MKEKLQGIFLKDGKIKKDAFLILILSGILLMVILWPIDGKKNETTTGMSEKNKDESIISLGSDASQSNTQNIVTSSDSSNNLADCMSSDEKYVENLENRLEEILTVMDGVGKVEVMITLESSEEKLIEKDTPKKQESTTEVDSAGGSRNTNSMENGDETIYIETQDGEKIPYVRKTVLPVIQGVMVAAQGGGSQTINKNITEAIVSLFGIESHKIKIVKMRQ